MASEPIFANEAILANEQRDSRDFGRRIRGIFVFGDDNVAFMF